MQFSKEMILLVDWSKQDEPEENFEDSVSAVSGAELKEEVAVGGT